MRTLSSLIRFFIISIIVILLQACPENKAKTECKLTPQADGTVKNECKSNKQVPDAGVDSVKKNSLSKGSYVLLETDKDFYLLDNDIEVNLIINTDQDYLAGQKVMLIRNKSLEDAARLILQPAGHIYALTAKDNDLLDKLLNQVLNNTSKSLTADMTYQFTLKPTSDKKIDFSKVTLRIWEKIPGQELTLVPTSIGTLPTPVLNKLIKRK